LQVFDLLGYFDPKGSALFNQEVPTLEKAGPAFILRARRQRAQGKVQADPRARQTVDLPRLNHVASKVSV
jgi:hypothetical protein